jgi:hypothetical protein
MRQKQQALLVVSKNETKPEEDEKNEDDDDDEPLYLLGDSKNGKTFAETYRLDKDVSTYSREDYGCFLAILFALTCPHSPFSLYSTPLNSQQ